MKASRTSASSWKRLMYHAASAKVAPRLSADDSADDSTDDASSPPPPSLSPDESIRPGIGVLGVLDAEVMVTIVLTF